MIRISRKRSIRETIERDQEIMRQEDEEYGEMPKNIGGDLGPPGLCQFRAMREALKKSRAGDGTGAVQFPSFLQLNATMREWEETRRFNFSLGEANCNWAWPVITSCLQENYPRREDGISEYIYFIPIITIFYL